MKKKILTLLGLFASLSLFSQPWELVGNTPLFTDFLGTTNLQPLNIRTSNIPRAQFTTGNALGVVSLIPGVGFGDGLRIVPRTTGCGIPSGVTASLDLWTSCSNGTHIRWDNSGQISGMNSRLEVWANNNGFYFIKTKNV